MVDLFSVAGFGQVIHNGFFRKSQYTPNGVSGQLLFSGFAGGFEFSGHGYFVFVGDHNTPLRGETINTLLPDSRYR